MLVIDDPTYAGVAVLEPTLVLPPEAAVVPETGVRIYGVYFVHQSELDHRVTHGLASLIEALATAGVTEQVQWNRPPAVRPGPAHRTGGLRKRLHRRPR